VALFFPAVKRASITSWHLRSEATPEARSIGKDSYDEQNKNGLELTTKSIHQDNTLATKRRFSIYWTWSYPWRPNRDVAELDNRFSTMTEVRRVAWPTMRAWNIPKNVFAGDRGTLELFTPVYSQVPGARGGGTGILLRSTSGSIKRDRDCRWTSACSQTQTP